MEDSHAKFAAGEAAILAAGEVVVTLTTWRGFRQPMERPQPRPDRPDPERSPSKSRLHDDGQSCEDCKWHEEAYSCAGKGSAY
jgi:hypothetical protein